MNCVHGVRVDVPCPDCEREQMLREQGIPFCETCSCVTSHGNGHFPWCTTLANQLERHRTCSSGEK